MTLYWSLIDEDRWNYMQNLGYLIGEEQNAMYPKEYLWMMEQMKQRLPNYTGEYPVWLWIKKPDLRSLYTYYFESKMRYVRLTIELHEEDVLVSCFDNWHSVLNDSFCADDQKESNDFKEGKLSITKEESWLRIFDFTRDRDPRWLGAGDYRQGVTGKITINKVKKVEHFVRR
ncbi:DUF3841 domain-containing protein [Paenibacillus sp. 2RAB27]|uniref:DUF3841 domain-containing protein n=1 Tax=Paenibacillus sp. 2RAB27 TaxID=3232991 RepID=UPI003F965F4F